MSPAPVIQLDLTRAFASRSLETDFPVMATEEIRAYQHDDHLIGLSLHARLEDVLTEEQSRRVRRVWLVPACKVCNDARRDKLEDVAYLVTLFGLHLRARGLDAHEDAEEVKLFADVVKLAHIHLRREAEFRRRITTG